MVFSIVAIFGSLIAFLQSIQQALSVQLTALQLVQVSLLIVGISGLALTIRNSTRKPQASRAPFYRLDKFDAKVEKEVYEVGQAIFFVASFTGLLRAGFFDSVLVSPNDELHYIWDPQTLLASRHLQEGELHGEKKDYHARWPNPSPILPETPFGEWTAHIGVYDCMPIDWWTLARVRFWLNWIVRRIIKKDPRFLAVPKRVCVDERTIRFRIVRRIEGI